MNTVKVLHMTGMWIAKCHSTKLVDRFKRFRGYISTEGPAILTTICRGFLQGSETNVY